jgi:hypothetical protein
LGDKEFFIAQNPKRKEWKGNMITKITPENITRYQALFEKVSKILKLEPAISTLDEYF